MTDIKKGKQGSLGSSSTRSQQSKLHSALGLEPLESRLTKNDLEKLKDLFIPDDDYDDTQIRLSRNQFSERLLKLFNKGNKEDYEELFDKIDITKEGMVDFNMFIRFLMLEFYEEDEKLKTTQVPQWKEIKTIASPHKDTIQRIDLIRASNRYLSVSKEGCIVFWDQHAKLQRSIKIVTDTMKPRDLWVTDFVLLPHVNKIAVSFTSKEIAFYDLSAKLDFNCQYKLQGLKSTPLCMDYWTNPDDLNESVLVLGDVGGEVYALCFSSAQIALFDRPSQASETDNNTTVHVRMKDLINDGTKQSNCRVVYHSAHSGWVRQVRYAEHLECFISCSTGAHNSVVVGYVEKSSSVMRTTSFKYLHGVHCFDYHQKTNLIATGSVNNQVCLWNPYVISKPVGVLSGHMAAVIQVVVNVNKSQLLSFSKDKVLRIWDIQQQACLQRLAGMFPKGPEVQTKLYFDDVRNRLFVTFNYQMTMLEMKVEAKNRVMSHDRPVTCAIYNTLYNQVISACQGGTVTVWMIDNGQKVKQFTDCHKSAEITTLELDHSRTRLFTGSTDGTIKVWDFNGHCHHSLQAGREGPADISQIVMLKRSIVVIGWDKFITVFRQGALVQYHVDPADWKGGKEHQDDILSAAYSSPSMLATGSYDGEIIIWNTNSECVSKKLQQRSRQKVIRRPITTASAARNDDVSMLRPMTSESQASELEFSFVISRLLFLNHRITSHHSGGSFQGADLVSCGGGGWVRFWSTAQCALLSEFVAHPHAGNAIATTDEENKYLVTEQHRAREDVELATSLLPNQRVIALDSVTADSDGLMKVWLIEDYLMTSPTEGFASAPNNISSWQAHTDSINSINICARSKRLFIVSASSDCSVALWDMRGNRVGEFGQEQHWKLNLMEPEEKMEEEEEPEDEAIEDETLFKDFDINDIELESRVSTALPPPSAGSLEYDPNFKAKTWKSTVLGKAYQEGRLMKRERKQPGTVPGFKDHSEESAVGPYGILEYTDLEAMPVMRKPDFMLHPHKYFGEKSDKDLSKRKTGKEEGSDIATSQGIREQRQVLKAAFDEKTLFPKELLDFEAQIRTEHAQKLRHQTSRDPHKKPKSMGILKSFTNSSANLFANQNSSNVGSKVSSRVGSSTHNHRHALSRLKTSSSNLQTIESAVSS